MVLILHKASCEPNLIVVLKMSLKKNGKYAEEGPKARTKNADLLRVTGE